RVPGARRVARAVDGASCGRCGDRHRRCALQVGLVTELEATGAELELRLGEAGLTVLDVRSEGEFRGRVGYPCDARQGHLPGARHLDLGELLGCGSVEEVRERVGLPEGAEIIAYCHSGSRSA